MARDLKLLILLLFPLVAFGQLTTDNSLTPDELVRDILSGGGVEIFNVTYTGAPNAIGSFDGSNSNINIPNGIILSTGTILDTAKTTGEKIGPVGPNNNDAATTNNGRPGDSNLDAISGLATKDAAILEFDFKPQGNEIEFRYVFASEEYIEYSNAASQINDVFAFIISGPGFANNTNIAMLPDGVTPVTIKNVNDWNNSQYFIYNGSGNDEPQKSDPTVVNFDGFTVVLTAKAQVQPCATYHLKIAIADGGDYFFDSGVFLEGGSLRSSTFQYVQGASLDPFGDPSKIIEGCSTGQLTLTRENNVNLPLAVGYRILGSAVNGTDYAQLSGVMNFVANQTTAVLNITPIQDAIQEGEEEIIIRMPKSAVCVDDSFDVVFTIVDPQDLMTETLYDTVFCPNQSVQLDPEISQGTPGYSVSWQGAGTGVYNVAPTSTKTYYYTASDTCGETAQDSAVVTVLPYTPLSVTTSNDTVVRCPGTMVNLWAQGVNGGGKYTYSWSGGKTTNSVSYEITRDSTIQVDVSDNCGDQIVQTITVDANYPDFSVSIPNDTIVCKGDSITLKATAVGGIPSYSYFWENSPIGDQVQMKVTQTGYITVSVFDSCGIIPAKDSVNIVAQQPISRFNIYAPSYETGEVIYFYDDSEGSIAIYDWDLGNGNRVGTQDAQNIYDDAGTYGIFLTVEDSLGCRDSSFKILTVKPPLHYYMPNAFTPNDDGVNDVFIGKGVGVAEFEMNIFDRWGDVVFSTTDINKGWDGFQSNGNRYLNTAVFVVKVKYKGENDEEVILIQHLTLLPDK